MYIQLGGDSLNMTVIILFCPRLKYRNIRNIWKLYLYGMFLSV